MNNKEMNEQDKKILQSRLKERRLFLNMTYQDLADKTGISKSTLQRYETGGIQNLPYDKIFALSEALEVSPEYFTDLSKDYTATSFITNNSIFNHSNRTEYLERIKEFERNAIEQITPALFLSGYKLEQRERGSIGDLVAIKGGIIWHLDFFFIRDIKSHSSSIGMQRHQLLMRFGRLAVYDKPITKYSIVVDSPIIAEQLVRRLKPVHLKIETSVILLTEKGFEEMFFW